MKPIPFVAKLSGVVVGDKLQWELPNQIEFDQAVTDVDSMSFKCPVTGMDLLTEHGDATSPALVLENVGGEIATFGTCDEPEFLQTVSAIRNGAAEIVGYHRDLLWWAFQVALTTPICAGRKYFGVDLVIKNAYDQHVYYIFEGERRAK